MKLYTIVSTIIIMSLIFAVGCSDRGVNYDKNNITLDEGSYFTKEGAHPFVDEFVFQVANKFQQLPLTAYWPKAAFPLQNGGEFKRVPMLVLLAPQDGDENFYFSHGLKEIADELISTGVIQPMAVLCVPNDPVFGGYFYAGESPAAGKYDDLIGGTLIDFVQDSFFVTTLSTQDKRAIGGIGMGAYGAYRAAIMHPGVFGAVSGAVGPMDFDGSDGSSGFIPLFDDALNEQGILGTDLSDNFGGNNSEMGPWHLTRLFIGGAFAFSAHDTLMDYTVSTNFLGQLVYDITVRDTWASTTDTVRLPSITPPNNATELPYGFHLPFDNSGAVATEVWDRWLSNNLETLLTNAPGVFDNINLWMGNSSEAAFGNFGTQTDSWINTLSASYNNNLTVYNFSGYSGHPADRDQYVFDLIREMLIFHSDQFGE